MVRPLAERNREYVRRPLNAVLGAPSHIAVLRSLYTTGAGLTGREIARSAGVAVQATHDALARLAAASLVRWTQAGRAHVYELNRDHFLFKNGNLVLSTNSSRDPVIELEQSSEPLAAADQPLPVSDAIFRVLEGDGIAEALMGPLVLVMGEVFGDGLAEGAFPDTPP
jgi:hypothetical protein